MQIPFVDTRLKIPPVQRELVPRPRLVERLNQGLKSKLTLVSTPAGYGKTMLLSAWAGQCRLPVAWMSLDEGDNDPARFLSGFIQAVRKVVPGLAQHDMALLEDPKAPSREALLAAVLNEIAQVDQPFVLVLDDYHLIKEPAIHQTMITLLGHLPPQMHLMIASRADPPLQLARLRARSQLTELRLADLCFTLEEARQFCNQVMKLDMQERLVATLTARTEGWIAGLQMAALTLRGATNPAERVESFSGSNRFILDYLGEEVLADQPEEIRAFLMKTSILDRLSGPLCDAVTGLKNSQLVLELLERDNLFIIPLDEERAWYRYHQLFLDLLQKQAGQHFAGELPGWHLSASRWFERSGELERAIHHALAAEDFERSAVLMERAAQPFLMRSEIYTLRNWVRRLPEAVLRAHPNLVLFHVWAMVLSDASPDRVEEQLQWVDQSDLEAAGKVRVIRGYLLFVQGEDVSAVQTLQRALAEIPAGEVLFRSVATYLLSMADIFSGRFASGVHQLERVVEMSLHKGQTILAAGALCNLAEVHVRLAQLPAAREVYERVLSIARDVHGKRLPIAAKGLIGLGDLQREWNDLGQAEANCVEGIELAGQLREAVSAAGYLSLSRIRQARGDASGAQAEMQKARSIAQQSLSTSFDDLYVDMYQAQLDLQQGNLDRVERWVHERGLAGDLNPDDLDRKDDFYKFHILKYELLVFVRWRLARGDPEKALFWLEPLRVRMEAQGRTQLLIEVLQLFALAHQQRGDSSQALAYFGRSLSLAEPGGYVRLFLNEGTPVRPLLQAVGHNRPVSAYASRLLAALDAETQTGPGAGLPPGAVPHLAQPSGLVEPLTEREIELLRLIAVGLSNQEIGQRLYISLPTVKWHLSNIFGKLGARSRTQAVAQARTLGLLPVD